MVGRKVALDTNVACRIPLHRSLVGLDTCPLKVNRPATLGSHSCSGGRACAGLRCGHWPDTSVNNELHGVNARGGFAKWPNRLLDLPSRLPHGTLY